jgi:hypothetical protein
VQTLTSTRTVRIVEWENPLCRSRRPRSAVHTSRGVRQTSAGVSTLHVLKLPALLAVAPVMWASQDARVQRTDAESGPSALGSLCSVATDCRGSRSVKRSKKEVRPHAGDSSAVQAAYPRLSR